MTILSWLIHCECGEKVVLICSKILRHFMTLSYHIQFSFLRLNNPLLQLMAFSLSFPYISCEAY